MGFASALFYLSAIFAIVVLLVPVIFSHYFRGWTSQFDSPPYTFDDIPDLTGKTIIVTGGNTGIGKVTVRELAKKGAYVILAARNEARGTAAKAEICAEFAGDSCNVEFMQLDLASFKSINTFATKFLDKEIPLDVLVNNAGVMFTPFSKTEDGFEMQIGTNHLGHFLLTKLLLPAMLAAAPRTARVVSVSSSAHRMSEPVGIYFDRFDSDKDYDEMQAYGHSKTANILFANELARRSKMNGWNIVANSLHPGVIETELGRHMEEKINSMLSPAMSQALKILLEFAMFLRMDSNMGALTQLYVATSPAVEGVSGVYYEPIARVKAPHPWATDAALAEKLWETSDELTKDFQTVKTAKQVAAEAAAVAEAQAAIARAKAEEEARAKAAEEAKKLRVEAAAAAEAEARAAAQAEQARIAAAAEEQARVEREEAARQAQAAAAAAKAAEEEQAKAEAEAAAAKAQQEAAAAAAVAAEAQAAQAAAALEEEQNKQVPVEVAPGEDVAPPAPAAVAEGP